MTALLHTLHWREPLFLLLALQPLLLYLLQRNRTRSGLNAYAEPHLQPWVVENTANTIWKRILSRDSAYVAGWVLCTIALAGPRVALEIPEGGRRYGLDVMMVVDASRSMTAADVQPNRLRRAQIELQTYLRRAGGNRAGLIVYAARPHLLAPLTADYEALGYYLDLVDSLAMPTHGSNAADALKMAHDEIPSVGGNGILLWVTDGDFSAMSDAQNIALDEVVKSIAASGQHLYILGTATEEGEALRDAEGKWLEPDGKAVVSRMDSARLAQLARLGDGGFSKLSDTDYDWERLYDSGMLRHALLDLDAEQARHVIWKEYFTGPLLLGLGLLLIAMLPYRPALIPPGPVAALAFLLAAGLAMPERTQASTPGDEQDAYGYFLQQDYARAARLYGAVPGYAGRFGEATSRYRNGDFAMAVRIFSQAALEAESDRQRLDALYNLGNSYFRLGDYQSAMDAFADALRYAPDHAPAQHNLSYSQLLQKQVLERMQEDSAVLRPGRGVRGARMASDADIDEQASISLGDATEQPPPQVMPSAPVTTSAKLIEALVANGLEHVRLAAQGRSAVPEYRRLQGLAYVRSRLAGIENEKVRHFQRLFEMEEGFPAPLDQTQTVPGIKPW